MRTLHTRTIAIILLVLAFVAYRRLRRLVGWQQLSTRSLWWRMIILALVVLAIFASAAVTSAAGSSVLMIGVDVLGLAVGIVLAWMAMQSTSFEQRAGKLWYRSNGIIGTAVLLLFLARLAFRFYIFYQIVGQGAVHNSAAMFSYYSGDVWLNLPFMIFAGYYVAYSWLLVRRVRTSGSLAQS